MTPFDFKNDKKYQKMGPSNMDSVVHFEGSTGVPQMLNFAIFIKWAKSTVYNLRTLLIGLHHLF